MDKYLNRKQAGKILAEQLQEYANQDNVIILALPRGGVPVAFEIGKALQAPLDIFIVRKLGVPGHRELAMGAIASGGTRIFNQDILDELSISDTAIQAVINEEEAELKRRETVYRGNHIFPSLRDKIIILVDDGIATGATIRAAMIALRQFKPAKIIVAVPVCEAALSETLEPLTDGFVCPLLPEYFSSVGAWYQNFDQTEDSEVHELLNEARKFIYQ